MKETKEARRMRILQLVSDYFHGAIEHPFRRQYFRVEASDWKQILLTYQDSFLHYGRVFNMSGKSIGSGVVEITIKESLPEEE